MTTPKDCRILFKTRLEGVVAPLDRWLATLEAIKASEEERTKPSHWMAGPPPAL